MKLFLLVELFDDMLWIWLFMRCGLFVLEVDLVIYEVVQLFVLEVDLVNWLKEVFSLGTRYNSIYSWLRRLFVIMSDCWFKELLLNKRLRINKRLSVHEVLLLFSIVGEESLFC